MRSVILHRINGKITEESNEENAGADFLAIVFLHRLNGGRWVRARDYLRNSSGEQESRYDVSRVTLRYSRAVGLGHVFSFTFYLIILLILFFIFLRLVSFRCEPFLFLSLSFSLAFCIKTESFKYLVLISEINLFMFIVQKCNTIQYRSHFCSSRCNIKIVKMYTRIVVRLETNRRFAQKENYLSVHNNFVLPRYIPD